MVQSSGLDELLLLPLYVLLYRGDGLLDFSLGDFDLWRWGEIDLASDGDLERLTVGRLLDLLFLRESLCLLCFLFGLLE